MDDAFARLEAEYCPPLDPALLSAILSDYDLGNDENVRNARATLEELKGSALLEEVAGFDASGTGGQEQDGVLRDASRTAGSCLERSSSLSKSTDSTSISNGLSSLALEHQQLSDQESGNAEGLERLDENTKLMLLQEMFGEHVSSYSIRHTLQKCNGKWNPAMEELLNHVYFRDAEDSDGGNVPTKGVEAFSEDHTARRGRKGKSKKKRFRAIDDRRSSSLPSSPVENAKPVANKWQDATEDIDFISDRTGLTAATVRSVYYERGSSVPHTIGALVKASMEESKHVVTDDVAVTSHARELGRDFPTIAPDYLTALIRLTHPSTTAAHELATAMTAKPKSDSPGGLQVIPQYAPVSDTLLNGSSCWQTVAKREHSSGSSQSPERGLPDASTLASAYSAARAAAYAQASAAHRKAKSDRLMGGAAAYYGQVGRDYAVIGSRASAAAADAVAASQSSSNQLDLHGIDVLNGVRIARDKVEAWYAHLGENRVNGRIGVGDRQTGYNIVVGLGRHSEGGKGKLGPAVSKMLRGEGWRIEPAGAVITVRGKQKR